MPGQQQQPKGDEGSLDFLWTIVLIVGILLVLWYFGKNYIASAIYAFRLVEINLIRLLVGLWDKLATVVPLPTPNISKLINWANMIKLHELPPTISSLAQVSTGVGKYFRFPILLILLFLAFRIYTKSVNLKFKQVFSMDSLKKAEKVNWPQIIPVVNLDLVHTDINEGPWAMAQNPMEFCRKNKLIREVRKEDKIEAELITGKAQKIFTLQLGPLWHGDFNQIPIHMQVLCAIFCAKAGDAQKEAHHLIDQIAESASTGKLNFTGYKALLNKYTQQKGAQRIMQSHGYVLTMMASMLVLARTAGVQATAELLWLKATDRTLWYTLNSVGRQTAAAEVAGIFAHWLTEKRLKCALRTPMVDEAVRGLKEALEDVLYEPEEE